MDFSFYLTPFPVVSSLLRPPAIVFFCFLDPVVFVFAENFLLFSGIVLLKGTFQLFFLPVLSVHKSHIGSFFCILRDTGRSSVYGRTVNAIHSIVSIGGCTVSIS